MKKNIDEYKAEGYLTLSNYGGITVQISADGDGAKYQWCNEKPSRWQKIKYTLNGRAFFIAYKTKYYLDEFMKVE